TKLRDAHTTPRRSPVCCCPTRPPALLYPCLPRRRAPAPRRPTHRARTAVSRSAILCAAALLLPAPPRAGDKRPPPFTDEAVPLLTRLGCNQGNCHGKGAGQNGFRLSLRGCAPELDHASLTRDALGRRVSPAVPEDSPLLRKPNGLAPHEGGKLFSPGG